MGFVKERVCYIEGSLYREIYKNLVRVKQGEMGFGSLYRVCALLYVVLKSSTCFTYYSYKI